MIWHSLTRRQGGLVARRQLRSLGLSAGAIDHLLAGGRLERTQHAGVYRAAGAPTTEQTAAWLAVLGSRSPLSYFSGAQWWGVPVDGDDKVHITRFDRRRLDWPAGVRVHRVALRRSDVVDHRGLTVVSRKETIMDCLGVLPLGKGVRLADRAVQQRWLTEQDVRRRLADSPGRWGNRRLRALLVHIGDGAAAESERRLHRILRDAGIGGWKPNQTVVVDGRSFEVDVVFDHVRLAIEVDGRMYHSADDRFQSDRTKQNALINRGKWTLLRFTWFDITERPQYVVAEVLAALAAAAA